ncbi:hypothetical protein MNB_SUP05-SYMBIONT-5-775 [hydrothermal vent metagenome]|uniref:Uncharacterized protein n=1 Tax=hydrothermal vent metagenome TaxID=652676 RepID=A0A1W1E4C9_9ZZZZ
MELSVNPALIVNDSEITGYAYSLAATGNNNKALKFLRSIVTKNPNNILAYKLQSDIFYKQGKTDKSKKSLQNVLNLSPNHAGATELLAKIFFQESNLKKSQSLLLNLEKKGKNLSLFSYKILAKIYEKQGQCDEALNYLSKSTGLRSGNSIQLEQAMMVKRCLGGNSLYLHGSVDINDNGKTLNRFGNYQK